jgi:hypothetical protein
MKQITLEQFQDKTALLPFLIAENVAGKRALPLRDTIDFCAYAQERTLFIYNHNTRFRKQLERKTNRETLYMFINHWLDSWIQKKGKVNHAH